MITKEQATSAPYSVMKQVAMAMYDEYCAAVGGKAYDGRPLPTAAEFFDDDTKRKQARGWFAAASKAIELILGDTNNGQN